MNLGGLLLRSERLDDALAVLTRAQRVAPKHPGILNNLGNALRKLGQLVEAEQYFRQALGQAPTHLQALLNLGRLVLDRRSLDEALRLAERAVLVSHGSAAAHRLLANAHELKGNLRQARHSYQQAWSIDPNDAASCSHLGLAALDTGDTQEAMTYLRRAATIAPRDADVLANLARGAFHADCIDEGTQAARTAIEIAPAHIGALVNLAALERLRGRFDDAERHCETALVAAPTSRQARLTLSIALMEMGRHEEAEHALDALLAADHGDAQAHWNRAISRLSRGHLDSGWKAFEWRWRLPAAEPAQPCSAPEWTGTSLQGKRIHVWPEQGLGDQILFASMIPDLLAQQARVTLECDARLWGLYRRAFPGVRLIPPGGTVEATSADAPDYQLPLGSLPQYLRPSLAAFAQTQPYLAAEDERRAHWNIWLRELGTGRKIGISWRSHNLQGERALACSRLEQWRPILERTDVRFVCMQYGDCTAEVDDFQQRFGARLHLPPQLDQRNDFDGIAALATELDLVISAPTTFSLLTGALGVPTWQLTSGIDWHGLNQPRLPWQPSVRRFHKPWDRNWDDELALVAAELDRLLQPGTLPPDQNASEASNPIR
jgi:tetratricopeptide (TPR) repeat protein